MAKTAEPASTKSDSSANISTFRCGVNADLRCKGGDQTLSRDANAVTSSFR
jgi:hypothetical protein